MKKYLYSVIAVFILTFSFTAPADAFEYSTSVKATFMQGCIFDDPPDFNNNSWYTYIILCDNIPLHLRHHKK